MLCQEFCSAFPLELRDLIYEYVITTQPPDHCWSAQYLGKECFGELMTTYYRIIVFELEIGSAMRPPWQPDRCVDAAQRRHVGSLQINLSFSARMAVYSSLNFANMVWKGRYLEMLIDNLKDFATFKPGMRITIIIQELRSGLSPGTTIRLITPISRPWPTQATRTSETSSPT
jgi:hypothetical protein